MTDDIARTIIADLLRVGTSAMTHRYRGQCPDVPCKGPEHATSRDPLCAACKALTRADVWMAGEVEPSPLSISAQVRARLGNGDLSLLMNTSRPASRIFSATWHREYPDGVVSDRRDADGPDVDACLRAVLAWEDSADREQPEHAPPAFPGPAEHVDMSLRFRYGAGLFFIPDRDGSRTGSVARPDHYRVSGLAIRIVYEHSAASASAAKDCAESWRSRMLGAGAREVECVGEVVT